MNRSVRTLCVSLIVALAACGSNDSSGKASSGQPASSGAPAKSASAKPAASAAPAPSGSAAAGPGCASIGCGDREGDFFNKCECKGKNMTPPLVAKYTGKMGAFKQPTFEVENTSDKPIQWASAVVYYYDKAGKQLDVEVKDRKEKFKNYAINGSNFTLKAKEKKEISFGWKDDKHPKTADKLEVVFDGWCYGTYDDKASELCVTVEKAPEERPASK